jgi:general stress protein YciG
MSGTPTGGIQARETNKANYGADYYARIGKKGGAVRNPNKGFGGMTHEKAAEAGRKGGTISRRGPKWMIKDNTPFSEGLEHASAEDAGR